jgi:hypothetical protein
MTGTQENKSTGPGDDDSGDPDKTGKARAVSLFVWDGFVVQKDRTVWLRTPALR